MRSRIGPRLPVAWLDWFDLRRSIVVLAGVIAVTTFVIRRTLAGGETGFGVLVLAPVAAVLAAPALIGLFTSYVRWVHERVWSASQGSHRAFDDHPIRVVEARDRLWFSTDDVCSALGLREVPARLRTLRTHELRRDPKLGCVVSNDGLVAWLGCGTDRRALRLVAWAEGDVRRPWQKRRDGERSAAAPPPLRH